MKKLMKLSVLLTAGLLLAGTLHAQVLKTYMSENFDSQTLNSGWSLSECTPITTSASGTLYVEQINDGSTTWGGWGYDPNKQIIDASIDNKLDGTYAMVTKSFRMEDNSINVVTLDYWYLGTSSNNSQERLFGVSVRTGNGEWQDLDSVQNMTNGLEGQISIILDEELTGQDVQLRFFFRNKHNANAYFFFLIDNVTFAAYKNAPYYSAHIANPYFYAVDAAENAEVNFDLTINNMGPKAISSLEYAYITDNGTQKNTTVSLSSPVAAVTGQASTKASIQFTNGIFGENNIKMWPVKVNGEDFEANATDTLTHQVVLIDKSKAKNDFVPMLESFTSATCGPCATMNRYLNTTLEELKEAGKINVVKYQMNFPGNGDKYYIASNRTRMSYYDQVFGWGGYWGVPSPIFNAESNMLYWPGQTYNDLMDLLKQRTETAHAQKAFMDINIKKAAIDAAGKLDFEIEMTSALDVTANVVVVITEKTTTGNRGSNGERSFHYVTMDAPLGGNGQIHAFKTNVPTSVSGSTDMSTTNMEEATDLEIVCFVQAPLQKNAYIFQSASADVFADVANENKDNLQVVLYPNPAKGYTVLKGLENAHVSVFDMTGRMVFNTKTSEESLNIDLSRFTAGTYMVRIEQNGATAHRKLVVTK